SGTTARSTLAAAAQVCSAWSTACCHAFVVAWLPRFWNRELALPSTAVPSGAKLTVRGPGFGHGMPHAAGKLRSSSTSSVNRTVFLGTWIAFRLADHVRRWRESLAARPVLGGSRIVRRGDRQPRGTDACRGRQEQRRGGRGARDRRCAGDELRPDHQ